MSSENRYQGMAMRIAVNADINFWPKKKKIDEKVQFLVMIFGQKLPFWTLLPNERGYEVKIGSCGWFLCLHNCKIYDLVL